MTEQKDVVREWPETGLSSAKRANLREADTLSDWFVGYGKDRSCQFEGSWWDMILMARKILASENTKRVAPDLHMPELDFDWYNDRPEQPYVFVEEDAETYECSECGGLNKLWRHKTRKGEEHECDHCGHSELVDVLHETRGGDSS